MRTWTLPLLTLSLAIRLVAQDSSSATPDLHRFTGFTLPVEISKTIKADKALPGDPVEFHMLEAVLAGNGVVIPAKAKLYGKVLLAAANNGQSSYLALLADRAEWDGHAFPLNAVLIGWGKRRIIRNAATSCAATMQPQANTRRSPTTVTQSQGAIFDECARVNRDSERDEPANWSHKLLIREIDIYRDANSGSTVLVSRKNIHLPSGMMVILQNVEETSVAAAKR